MTFAPGPLLGTSLKNLTIGREANLCIVSIDEIEAHVASGKDTSNRRVNVISILAAWTLRYRGYAAMRKAKGS